jgi:hypothetical protein
MLWAYLERKEGSEVKAVKEGRNEVEAGREKGRK